jgi:hypothetical protein
MDSTAPIPRLRADRYDLAAPVVLDTGARRVEAVIARVGVLPYPWGREYVPASTLADPAWLSSLAGVPLLYARDGHPDRPWTIEDSAGAERVGVVLSARYDAASEAVVAEVVVDTAEGVELLARGVRGVSPWYTAETDAAPGVTPGGEVYDLTQTRRTAANHVVLTSTPRGGPGVEVRADAATNTGSSMDEEMKVEGEGAPAPEIEVELEAETPEAPPAPEGAAAALVASLLEALAPQHAAMMEKMDAMCARMDAIMGGAPAAAEMRADSRAVRLAWREVETAARVVGVELPDDLTLTAARRKVATGLGVERADALTGPELSATLRAARVVLSSPRRDAWSRVAADTRADSRPAVPSLDHLV